MDYKYIEQLLDRYFAAETTLQEEQILKTFYSQHDGEMPQDLSQYAPLFEAFEPEEQLGDEFDERLLAMTEEVPVVKARTISLAVRLRPLFSAAAVVAILLTMANALNVQLQSETATKEDIVMASYDAPKPLDQPTMAFEQNSLDPSLVNDSVKVDTVKVKI